MPSLAATAKWLFFRPGSMARLAHRIEAWFSQRSRHELIQQAMQQAQADAASLTAQHNALEAQANASSDAAAANSAKPDAQPSSPACSREGNSASFSASTMTASRPSNSSREFTASGQTRSMLQHRIVTHMALRSLATVAFILICVILLESAGTALLERTR